jgi:hypothetical protein
MSAYDITLKVGTSEDVNLQVASDIQVILNAGVPGPVGAKGDRGEKGDQGAKGDRGISASMLSIPSDYDSFSLTRTSGNITSVSYVKNGSNVATATLTWLTNTFPARLNTISDGTKTLTISYDGNGIATGGVVV